jgi:hypothetical protein
MFIATLLINYKEPKCLLPSEQIVHLAHDGMLPPKSSMNHKIILLSERSHTKK